MTSYRILQRSANFFDDSETHLLEGTWDSESAAREHRTLVLEQDEFHAFIVVSQLTVDAAYQEAECWFAENDIKSCTQEEFDAKYMYFIEIIAAIKVLDSIGKATT